MYISNEAFFCSHPSKCIMYYVIFIYMTMHDIMYKFRNEVLFCSDSDLIILVTVTVHVVYGESASACYGTHSCDYYTMKCPSSKIIRLNNLYAGYKNTSVYPVSVYGIFCIFIEKIVHPSSSIGRASDL